MHKKQKAVAIKQTKLMENGISYLKLKQGQPSKLTFLTVLDIKNLFPTFRLNRFLYKWYLF